MTVPPPAPVPVPVSKTVCGLFVALSVKSKLAVRVPATVGAKIMFAVQLAETARVVPHVLLNILKSVALVPLMEMLLMVSVVAPPFVSVTTFCPPAFPTATLAHEIVVGEAATAAIAEVPLSAQSARSILRIGTVALSRLNIAS